MAVESVEIRRGLEAFTSFDVMRNMSALAAEPYPGRIVAGGISADGSQLHLATATMGRSPGSRTRTYEALGENVRSMPFGEKVDPLTKYMAMTGFAGWQIASNGEQTEIIFDALVDNAASGLRSDPLDVATGVLLEQRQEPDTIHTPRITLVVGVGLLMQKMPAQFSILRTHRDDPENDSVSERRFYRGFLGHLLQPGHGFAISTYEADGNPPLPFEGGPRPVAIGQDAEETADMFASVLDQGGDNVVSVAVKALDIRTGRLDGLELLNKYGPNPNYPQPTQYQ